MNLIVLIPFLSFCITIKNIWGLNQEKYNNSAKLRALCFENNVHISLLPE